MVRKYLLATTHFGVPQFSLDVQLRIMRARKGVPLRLLPGFATSAALVSAPSQLTNTTEALTAAQLAEANTTALTLKLLDANGLAATMADLEVVRAETSQNSIAHSPGNSVPLRLPALIAGVPRSPDLPKAELISMIEHQSALLKSWEIDFNQSTVTLAANMARVRLTAEEWALFSGRAPVRMAIKMREAIPSKNALKWRNLPETLAANLREEPSGAANDLCSLNDAYQLSTVLLPAPRPAQVAVAAASDCNADIDTAASAYANIERTWNIVAPAAEEVQGMQVFSRKLKV